MVLAGKRGEVVEEGGGILAAGRFQPDIRYPISILTGYYAITRGRTVSGHGARLLIMTPRDLQSFKILTASVLLEEAYIGSTRSNWPSEKVRKCDGSVIKWSA